MIFIDDIAALEIGVGWVFHDVFKGFGQQELGMIYFFTVGGDTATDHAVRPKLKIYRRSFGNDAMGVEWSGRFTDVGLEHWH